MKTLTLLLCCLVPCAAFVAKSPSAPSSSALAASRIDVDDAMHGLGRFAAAAALSLAIFANPAPSLADGEIG